MNNTKTFNANMIAKMGMLTAFACILGLVRFPLLPMTPFLTYDLADIPIIIGAFAFGPLPGIMITVVVSAIQAFALGGDGLYGFLMHVIASGTFVLLSSCIYRRHKTKKVAIISLIVATLSMTVLMGISNCVITTLYYGGTAGQFMTVLQQVILPLLPFILLFNLIKGTLNSLISFFTYKRISGFLHSQSMSFGKK